MRLLEYSVFVDSQATVLIKGISSRLGIPWSLAKEWAPTARQVLEANYTAKTVTGEASNNRRVRFAEVLNTLKQWSKGRATKVMRKLPPPIRTRVANVLLKREERKSRRALTARRRES